VPFSIIFTPLRLNGKSTVLEWQNIWHLFFPYRPSASKKDRNIPNLSTIVRKKKKQKQTNKQKKQSSNLTLLLDTGVGLELCHGCDPGPTCSIACGYKDIIIIVMISSRTITTHVRRDSQMAIALYAGSRRSGINHWPLLLRCVSG